MPTYDFIDNVTGKEWSEFMSIADMETLKKNLMMNQNNWSLIFNADIYV